MRMIIWFLERVCVGCCLHVALLGSAYSVPWNGAADQDWNNDANWVGGAQPASVDDVQISTSGTGNFPIVNTTGEVARDIFLGQTADGHLEIRAGGSLSARSIRFGNTASFFGSLLMTDGTVELTGQLQLGVDGDAFGIATLSGGTMNVGNVQSGNLIDRRDVKLGVDNPNDGDSMMILDGALLVARDVIVSNGATGLNEFDINAGTLDARSIQIAHGNDTVAFAVMTGGDAQVAEDIIVADGTDSDGSFDMIDGSLAARSLLAAVAVDSLATITMLGGLIDTSGRGDVVIGQAGEAELLMTGGTIHAQNMAVALVDGSGSVELTGGLLQTDQDLSIGMDQFAFGSVDQRGGTASVGGNLLLTGNSSNATALYLLSGGTLDMTGGNVLFNSGFAEFTFFGGRLQHVGNYGATLNNDGGTLAPGGSVGTTTIQGDYSQSAGTYEAQVDGALDAADAVVVQGTSTLGGELQVVGLAPYPAVGDYSKTVLTANSVVGTFVTEPHVQGTGHTGHGIFAKAVHYSSNSVTVDLFQAKKGDADGDRDVDITDFNTLAVNFDPFRANAETNDWVTADFDIDGDVDITDFNSLAIHFAPFGYAVAAPQSVPEPHGWMTVVSALAMLFAVWRAK